MSLERPGITHRGVFMVSVLALLCIAAGTVQAREIGIAFIEDGVNQAGTGLSTLVVQELQPLLGPGDTVVPVVLRPEGTESRISESMAWALSNRRIDYIVATGFLGSQELYQRHRFEKPTYLLRLLDPALTGAPVRDKVRGLRSYSVTNEIVEVFKRVRQLLQTERAAILLPQQGDLAQRTMGKAVTAAASQAGIEVQFLSLDYTTALAPQLPAVDTVILPPVALPEGKRDELLQALKDRKLPSYVVGGDSLVLHGALVSDTLDDDERVLARKVALDLQLAVAGEAVTMGVRSLDPRKRTTINIDTARALDVDFTLDELMTARVVQGSSGGLGLGFLSVLETAADRNLSLARPAGAA